MRKRIIRLISALLIFLFVISGQTFSSEAASYPLLFPKDSKYTQTVKKGEIVQLEYEIWPEFKNEEIIVRVYDSHGYEVANTSHQFYNTGSTKREFTGSWDTSKVEPGTYTVVAKMKFYSLYRWNEAPSDLRTTVIVEAPSDNTSKDKDPQNDKGSKKDNTKTDTGNKQTVKKGTWKQDKKGWWYSYSDGSYAKNTWLKIGGKWYYFNSNGYMAKSWKKLGGKWYFFGTNGVMKTGWQKIGGKWYYFGSNGVMVTGWKKISGKWYYFEKGVMVTGDKTIGGVKYSFDKNGVMFENKKTKPQTVTKGMENALKSAKSYLGVSSFSYKGLIGQLEYEGYSESESTYGADYCGADWYEQALKSAKSYLKSSAFSYSGLVNQLEYAEFTHEQAVYGVDNCGANWKEQAKKCAESYMKYSSFSKTSLISQLEFEGFSREEAEYGVEAVGY